MWDNGTERTSGRHRALTQEELDAAYHERYDPAVESFRHKAGYLPPRYSPVLAIAWLCAGAIVAAALVNLWLYRRWHYAGDAAVAGTLLVCISLLWSAWTREERYPQCLPKREFERRYPPSSGSGPSAGTTMTGGQVYAYPFSDPEYRARWLEEMRVAPPARTSEGGGISRPYGNGEGHQHR